MAAAKKTLCIIAGAGQGLGQALGLAFSKTHAVALLARSTGSLEEITKTIKDAGGIAAPFTCDVSSAASVASAFKEIRSTFPNHALKVGIFNANSPFIMKPFLSLTEAEMRLGIDVTTMGGFHFSQLALPYMLEDEDEKGFGSLFFTGATAALRGSDKFAALSPGKFALRGLSQNIAREFMPKGVHVTHFVVDGMIDTPSTRAYLGQGELNSRLDPDEIAKSYVFVSEQGQSCWTHEMDLRPHADKW